ncbi:hypothetical protein RND71_018756 [Anisodus tanguticus]|uniref:Uncharacterized protein n=1 Tax=Anisodus tanguticus TaxID=243964 RepID=A0AAE1S572_9SOLA|nr:hypothetical protein RND71_018756 [Anisodus tanguticus]
MENTIINESARDMNDLNKKEHRNLGLLCKESFRGCTYVNSCQRMKISLTYLGYEVTNVLRVLALSTDGAVAHNSSKVLVINMEEIKKGAWSPEEDQKLKAYIMRYGIWNWNLMPKFAGLSRTGKSCRLRWMNYLRPDVKRGPFSMEEVETVIKMYQELGNSIITFHGNQKMNIDDMENTVILESNPASTHHETDPCFISESLSIDSLDQFETSSFWLRLLNDADRLIL